MIDYDTAIALLAERMGALPSETIPLEAAQRRVLAKPVIACITAPSGDASAMDGIAVRDSDVAAGKAVRLIGASFAGQPFTGAIGPDEAVRIYTGALLPPGADRVIMQEHVRFDGESAHVEAGYGPGWHVRHAGEDFRVGDILLQAGCYMGAGQLLCAAAADAGQVAVVRQPRVHILATGSELVAPGMAAQHPATIPDSVTAGIAAMVRDWGGLVIECERLEDDLAVLRNWARDAVCAADVIIVTGGASVGARDYAQAMFAKSHLELVFAKVAIKPGTPIWIGRCDGTWIVGLPGNPTSAFVTARLFLAPLLTALGGRAMVDALKWRKMRVAVDVQAHGGGREVFLLGEATEDGVSPLIRQDSGGQAPLALADHLLRSTRCHEDGEGRWSVACLAL